MSDVKLTTYASLMTSLNEVKATADAVGLETSAHADAHFAKLEALRKSREHDAAIVAGIDRATSTV